ncbi:hypothetical protein Pmar_PMAR026907 [Perkinsus marinus ATCC 50983]|uniref:Uncharacterized protein n=1 Tax=Perkinsus marinus (strain ATCC 50983 / TXsc) TaxID=423536 RepID=C5LV49_PERM5|nr:hypothetical protein Pmar_PMAR026907 [Perkinsus marinus ATCC 50983]EEQ99393.1 hypothetical protein Pmar_PMAR026907 [Perkinsus marinus ATCC 50983]|eukprot:XP_002766676.1 hypothetical protein Pmar_PMAR026907 [Perkinsus marinus ATCC 50983]
MTPTATIPTTLLILPTPAPNVHGGTNNGIEHAANESREEAPLDNANEADGDPLNAGLTSSSLHDKLWDREVIQVIHNLTSGGGRPSNSEKQQPVVTLADLFKKAPHLRGISYDLHPSDRYIQEVCWASPGVARTVNLLTILLSKFASENEKIDEDNLLMSDMVVCSMRWAFSVALLSTYFPDSPTVEIRFLAPPKRVSELHNGSSFPMMLHSDAEDHSQRIAGVLLPGSKSNEKGRFFSEFTPESILRSCNHREIQITAALFTILTFAPWIRGKSAFLYVDTVHWTAKQLSLRW